MPKTTKTNTAPVGSGSKRSSVWKPTDIQRAGSARKKSLHSRGLGQPNGVSHAEDARPKLELVQGNGGSHLYLAAHADDASPTTSQTPAEMPGGDVHEILATQPVVDVPTSNATQVAGEDRAINRTSTDQTAPDPSTPSAARKRGRPRKTSLTSRSKSGMSSAAPITETPAKTPVGEGQVASETQSNRAFPINDSSGEAMNVESPIGTESPAATPSEDQDQVAYAPPISARPDPASHDGGLAIHIPETDNVEPGPVTETPAPRRGRQRKAERRVLTEDALPTAAPKPVRKGRLPRQTNKVSDTKPESSDAALHSTDPAETLVGDGQSSCDNRNRVAVPNSDSSVEALGWVNHHLYTASDAATPSEDQATVKRATVNGLPDLASIVAELQELQKKRIFCIKSQMRQSSATLALLRTLLGWIYRGNETENAKINKRARELVKHVEVQERLRKAVSTLGDMHPDATDKQRKVAERELSLASNSADKLKPLEGRELEVSIHYRQVILASAQANAPWDTLRDEYEGRMRDLAHQLPVFPWVNGVRGFAEIGLAKIVGEAGDLSKYDNPAKLWKRLGLAVINGRRQGDPGPGASAEDWTLHGYNPKRRSEVWNITDSLIRASVRGAREDPETGDLIDGYALSYYGKVYLARKAYETKKNGNGDYAHIAASIVARSRGKVSPENLEGRLTKKHVDSRARRYVSKRLIKHLWQRWRNPTVPETDVHTDTGH